MIMPSTEETLWRLRDLPKEEVNDKIEEIRPEVPVMAVNTRQIKKYIPELVDSVYKKHEIKPETKQRKKMVDQAHSAEYLLALFRSAKQ